MKLNVNEFPGVLNRTFLGFEDAFDRMQDFVSKEVTNYPPHNLVKIGDNKFVIELAVAGFKKEEIDIELHDGTLKIRGVKSDTNKDQNVKYLHQGLAMRNFQREFQVVNTIEARGADITDGILKVYLENKVPEDKKPRKVAIGATDALRQLLTE